MSDRELEWLRRQKAAQLRKRLVTRKEQHEKKSPHDVFAKVFVDRAWDVYRAAQTQYPHVADQLEDILLHLIASGKVRQVSGSDLYSLLQRLGVQVKLKTTIRIVEHGRLQSIEEKMKEHSYS